MKLSRTAAACVAGLALGIVPLTAGSALAAGSTATVTQAGCVAGGGTYSSGKGYKSCTTPTGTNTYDQVMTSYLPDGQDGYIGSYHETEVFVSYTVVTQKGKTTTTRSYLSSESQTRVPGSEQCYYRTGGVLELQPDTSQCVALGLL